MRNAFLNPSSASASGDAALDDPSLIALRSGNTELRVAPRIGGSIAAYFETTAAGPLHWMRPATRAALDARNPLQMASFPLFPYCNRIRDARFDFDGQSIDLSGDGNTFTHALHGNAWRRAWRVGARTTTSVELHLEHTPDGSIPGDWPFAYQARQTIELIGDVLRVTLSARNLADRAMPFGMGHHPYYPRTPNTVVKASVDAMWHADPDVLPTHLGAHPAVEALRDGMSADAFDLDNNFTGWKREAVIAWTDEHRKLTLTADETFGQMVVFAPASEALLCVEPVSNTTDCFNSPADARENVGGCVLEPGESITGVLHWTPARY
ncbi:aldose 1-epimerase [Paraburkholderia sartisoli]|uniref:Aldose 1-epimerase n=1 Tax=Paraburkholderia sartisoli TaxID=83784 RepID=A0A1H3XU37_9BURK|nr:aldose 1-epimerase [Paraburkholderia sartisoli]SEA02896.1 aldose 1-epimerase [Paraburkholderia sartisoli]